MPIYEYQCRGCGRKFEIIQSGGVKRKPACPGCGSRRVARLVSPAGFILKGSGWYKTDYPSESRKKGMEAEKGGGGAAEAGKERKEGEAKPLTAGKEGETGAPSKKKEPKGE